MKKRKAFVQTVCVLLAILMVLSISVMVIVPAMAATKAELQTEIGDLETQQSEIEARLAEIEAQIADIEYQNAAILEKKAILDEKNRLAQEELDVIEEQIAIITTYMANRHTDLEEARAEEETQREALLERMRAMEENSGLGYLQVLFGAADFSDLLTRMGLINEILVYDEELWQSYIAARENVEDLEAEALEMYALNEANQAEFAAKKAQLEADILAADQMIAELESTREGYNALRAEEEAAMEEVMALIEEKTAELDEILWQEQQAARPGPGTSAGGSGSLLWPSYTTWITSYYGMRIHPEYGDYRMHHGVDIGAAGGTAIWAPADGTVTVSAYSGGYGNYVSIAHDNGYSTLCAHMTSRAVSAGERVSQGQIIGYVGSTGVSNGNHIHFEVYAGGSRIDPLSIGYIYA